MFIRYLAQNKSRGFESLLNISSRFAGHKMASLSTRLMNRWVRYESGRFFLFFFFFCLLLLIFRSATVTQDFACRALCCRSFCSCVGL